VAACGGGQRARDVADWPDPNLDLAGTRNAPSPITKATIGRLRVAWRFRFPEQPTFSGVDASTALVAGGRVFVQTLSSNVYALDLGSGRLVWRRRFDRESGGPNGLSDANGLLFGNTDVSAFALSAQTGRIVWQRRLAGGRSTIDIAPTVARGLVFTATAGIRLGTHGILYALNARSGRIVWRFDTIRGRFAVPAAAGGGGAWWSPTVDAAGRLYVGIANPLPFGGTRARPNGAAYRGRALYTDSLVVLDASHGTLLWYDQVTSHDVRDYDFALPPILESAGGIPAVFGAGKAGIVIAWNRATHKRIWQTPVGVHRNDSGPLPTKRVSVCPGLYGGVLTPMAYADGKLFVPVVDLCMQGSAYGYEPLDKVDVVGRGRGELVALDAATGKRDWTVHLPLPDFSCATAARGVVFTASFDGTVYGLDTRDGRRLWTARTPSYTNSCPAVAGDTLLVGAGVPTRGRVRELEAFRP
jgi:outer membrane protein assembly factor BamB